MSKDRPIRVELSKEEIFEMAFFLGYAAAVLPRGDRLHARAEKLLQLIILAESNEAEPTITIEGLGVEQ